jgi:NDP-sugar pyrophosphorylase family protein
MLKFHRENKALATIALKPVQDVSNYGVVVADETGRIEAFQEKPTPQEALSNVVNTGIYLFEPEIFELIPEGFYDFGRQLFPRLLERKNDSMALSRMTTGVISVQSRLTRKRRKMPLTMKIFARWLPPTGFFPSKIIVWPELRQL